MKTFKNLLLFFFVLVVGVSSEAALVLPVVADSNISAPAKSHLVKAAFINGVWIPVIDLPEIEITGNSSGNIILKGIIRDGEVIALIDLPVVEIAGERVHNFITESHHVIGYEPIYNIPVIEISADFPVQSLVQGVLVDNGIVTIVNLPEIIISETRIQETNFVVENIRFFDRNSGTNYSFDTKLNNELLTTLIQAHPARIGLENYTISISNCVIKQHGKKVCEMVINMGNMAADGIRENLIQAITR